MLHVEMLDGIRSYAIVIVSYSEISCISGRYKGSHHKKFELEVFNAKMTLRLRSVPFSFLTILPKCSKENKD